MYFIGPYVVCRNAHCQHNIIAFVMAASETILECKYLHNTVSYSRPPVLFSSTDVHNFTGMCLVLFSHQIVARCSHVITKTCPCNVYTLEPHFYIAKLGYEGVYLFFLFLLQNIDCGYSLEPPR